MLTALFAAKLNRAAAGLAKLLSVKLNRARWRGRAPDLTVWFLLAIGLVFIAAWHRVLLGDHVLVGGDVLFSYPPWSGTPHAHTPTNWLTADVVREFAPWLGLERHAVGAGHLPLWNPSMIGGKPLLANYISAFFSPFTWIGLPIGGARGYSLEMLAKLVVAGVGTWAFLRMLRVPTLAACVGGLLYASCSYMTVWLGWPHSSAAALIPWAFLSVEGYLRRPSLAWAVPVAVAVALELLAGHPETSLVLAEGLAIYVVVRLFEPRPGRLIGLAGLALAVILGVALAGVQWISFLAQFSQTTLGSYHPTAGSFHLPLSELSSWLAPNLYGNPGIDGLTGRPPHYNASTGFVGVGALALAVIGGLVRSANARLAQISFVVIALVSLGIAYGPLTGVVAALPVLKASYSIYAIVLTCFALACLAALGVQALLSRPRVPSTDGWVLLIGGWIGLALLAGLAVTFIVLRARAETIVRNLPASLHGGIGFWALVAAASLLAAAGLTAGTWRLGPRGPAMASLLVLVLIEAGLFAIPYQPQVPIAEAPPPSQAVAWLQQHAGDRPIAALGLGTLIPEAASWYGLSDVRSYDILQPLGARRFWSLADPHYYNDGLNVWLDSPGVEWLAAAGVPYVVKPGADPLPGTTVAYQGEGVTISAVPNALPFAFASDVIACAPGPDQAAAMLQQNGPRAAVVLETRDCPPAANGDVTVRARRPERVELSVDATGPTVVVLLQSYTADWTATVDGRSAPVMPADLQFQAVAVPAGRHDVILTYAPPSVRLGSLLSLVSILVLTALSLTAFVRRRLRPKTEPIDKGPYLGNSATQGFL